MYKGLVISGPCDGQVITSNSAKVHTAVILADGTPMELEFDFVAFDFKETTIGFWVPNELPGDPHTNVVRALTAGYQAASKAGLLKKKSQIRMFQT